MSDRDDSVVSFDRPRGAPPERLREFLETARRIKQERAAADVVNELLRATVPEAWPTLATRPELQTNGALERLGNESRERLDRKPLEALALAELATTIADALPADSYPPVVLAQTRAGAWKDRANALRYLGRHEEAFDAISHAEKTLMRHAALAVDRAVVDLVKATIIHELGNSPDAHLLLDGAEVVFVDIGDAKYVQFTRLIRANLLYNDEHYLEAFDRYSELFAEATDTEMLAALSNNLGHCSTHLGDFVSANIHFSEAISRFTDLGYTAEAARTKRGAGLLLIQKGQYRIGLEYLRDAHRCFNELGMVRDACLCGLYVAEALYTHSDSTEAREILRETKPQLAKTTLSPQAEAAFADLERVIADENSSVDPLRVVQSFIAAFEVAEARTS